MIKIELLYGDGFTGRTYWLILDGDNHVLLGPCGGSDEDEEMARARAREILLSEGMDPNILYEREFQWDGTM